MADQLTLEMLGERRRWRSYFVAVLGVVSGLAAKALFGFSPLEALLNGLQPVTGLAPWIKAWLLQDSVGKAVASWSAAPLGLCLLGLAVTRLRSVKAMLLWIFPDPPPFVSADLDALRRRTMTNLEREPLEFVGRVGEMARLEAHLEDMERWGLKLIEVCDDRRFYDDVEIRQANARTAYNAIVGRSRPASGKPSGIVGWPTRPSCIPATTRSSMRQAWSD